MALPLVKVRRKKIRVSAFARTGGKVSRGDFEDAGSKKRKIEVDGLFWVLQRGVYCIRTRGAVFYFMTVAGG